MFETKGDQPQWQVIYGRLAGMQIGDTIKDQELFTLLPDAPEGSVRSAFWRAVKQIEDDHKRTFDRERQVGYRMVEAVEHERLARGQHKRARRRLKSAYRKAHSADRARLSHEERQRLDAIELHLAQQQDMIRRLDAKVKTEARERRAGDAELSERVDQLAALLAKHGIGEHAVI